jgi:hypothetical protein
MSIFYKIHTYISTPLKCFQALYILLFLFTLLGRRAFLPPPSSPPGPCPSATAHFPPCSARSAHSAPPLRCVAVDWCVLVLLPLLCHSEELALLGSLPPTSFGQNTRDIYTKCLQVLLHYWSKVHFGCTRSPRSFCHQLTM